jgi:hypothetical protein
MNIAQTQTEKRLDEKKTIIIVNGREREFAGEVITFEQVITIANLPTGENYVYTVDYESGHGNKPDGHLLPGQSLKVKKGMVFHATATDKS